VCQAAITAGFPTQPSKFKFLKKCSKMAITTVYKKLVPVAKETQFINQTKNVNQFFFKIVLGSVFTPQDNLSSRLPGLN
jgi:hypothetical protein